ncbi:MAG: hypothetical protein J5601_00490, partial [Elusimicrobiaceae bacterium]|nr:hypothetical protein [Elusimicrobiaceae bacterium]
NKIVVCDSPLFYYNRQNGNSLSRGKFRIHMLDYFTVTDEFLEKAKELKDPSLQRIIIRQRLALICGFFKRMMLSNFNDQNILKPMQQELRRNLWLLLLRPRPLLVTAFGICCCISFKLTKKLFLAMVKLHIYAPV